MEKKTMTTATGAPVADNQNSITAGERGPIIFEDFHLFEKLAHFNRERIPERVVHAKGSGAFGELVITKDITNYTKANLFAIVGKKTPLFIRFSTVGGESGSADTERDPRGFAMKFYTEEGIWDLVGNNTPVFFIRDPSKFPDFIHTQKRDPKTHLKDSTMRWDFWSLHPESLHQVTILFSDRGIPDGFRFMDGFGSHTFSMINAKNERVFVKYHFKTRQGIKNLPPATAMELAGSNLDYAQQDLLTAIEKKNFPEWTFFIQVMTEAQAGQFPINPFDVTKVWPHKQHPMIEVGTVTLNRNPENYFADVEQAAFSPAAIVPGLGFSPDRMLQGRLFSYADAHRYRLGVNHHQIPVNAPQCETKTYHHDGANRVDGNHGDTPNYHPNSFDGVTEDKRGDMPASNFSGPIQRYNHRLDDDYYTQPGNLFRLMNTEQKSLLISNIVGTLKLAPEFIQKRQVEHFTKADKAYGEGVKVGLGKSKNDHAFRR